MGPRGRPASGLPRPALWAGAPWWYVPGRMPLESPARAGALHGRYVIGDEIAAGGMATVHLGRMLGDAGFARTVAIKRLHPQFAEDPDICAMLLDEGRLAARIHHLNVVTTLDVVASGGELFVVMEYVHGEALSALIRSSIRRSQQIPARIVAAIVSGALRGLHAAHEARDAHGDPLGVVHRDISPQNILVSSDGIARVLDFGIAKAAGRMHTTMDGRIKGKFGYMPPEQLHAERVDRRADIYASGVVLWESLVGARLFAGRPEAPNLARAHDEVVAPPSSRVPALLPAHDAVVLRALAREPDDRFGTALEMAEALEGCGPVAPPAEVGAWVVATAGELLAERAARIAAVETRLVTGIRDSIALITASDARVTRLEGVQPTPIYEGAPRSPAYQGRVVTEPQLVTQLTPTLHAASPPIAPSPPETAPRTQSSAPPPALEPPPPLAPPAAPAAWNDPLPGRGSAALWIGMAALGAVAIAATFVVIASVPAESKLALPPSAEPPPSSAPPPSPALSATAEPTATAAPSASAASSSAPHAKAAPPPPSPPPPPHRPAADACSPPFTLDAAGHKHYKRECLR